MINKKIEYEWIDKRPSRDNKSGISVGVKETVGDMAEIMYAWRYQKSVMINGIDYRIRTIDPVDDDLWDIALRKHDDISRR